MEQLKDFKNLSFIDQMTVLTRLGERKEKKVLPGLFELYNQSSGDKTVDAMIEHTLRDVLADHQDETLERLVNGSIREKRLCLKVVGKAKFTDAARVLLDMAEHEENEDILTQVFIAMSKLNDCRFLDTFRQHVHHHNEIIAGISIEMIGKLDDTTSEGELEKIVRHAGEEPHYEQCEVITAEAIDSLGQMADDCSIAFLVSQIHHKNPTARRMIQENLVNIGGKVVPFFKQVFQQDNDDKKIMAANILGRIGMRIGGNILVNALDQGLIKTPNVKAAVYEALGFIPSMKGVVCLIDAMLHEENLQVMITAATSLEMQVNPGMIEEIRDIILRGGSQADHVIEAIIVSRAVTIFQLLLDHDQVADILVDSLLLSEDSETLSIFAAKLETMENDYSHKVMEKVHSLETRVKHQRVLVVDDSRPMLLFYRRHLTAMDLEPITAMNGEEAMAILDTGLKFNVIIIISPLIMSLYKNYIIFRFGLQGLNFKYLST